MRIQYAPEELAEAEEMGLAPFHRYNEEEAAVVLGLDIVRLRHLIVLGELKKVHSRGHNFIIGAELARWRRNTRLANTK